MIAVNEPWNAAEAPLFAVDLASGMRGILSRGYTPGPPGGQNHDIGDGCYLGRCAGLHFDEASQIAYVTDGSQDALVAVDVVTADRVLISR